MCKIHFPEIMPRPTWKRGNAIDHHLIKIPVPLRNVNGPEISPFVCYAGKSLISIAPEEFICGHCLFLDDA